MLDQGCRTRTRTDGPRVKDPWSRDDGAGLVVMVQDQGCRTRGAGPGMEVSCHRGVPRVPPTMAPTLSSLAAVHGEVGGLVSLQPCLLHTWPVHLHPAGVAALTHVHLWAHSITCGAGAQTLLSLAPHGTAISNPASVQPLHRRLSPALHRTPNPSPAPCRSGTPLPTFSTQWDPHLHPHHPVGPLLHPGPPSPQDPCAPCVTP